MNCSFGRDESAASAPKFVSAAATSSRKNFFIRSLSRARGDRFGDGFAAGGLILIERPVHAACGPVGSGGVLAVVLVVRFQTGDLGFQFGELGGDLGLL